LDAAGYELLAQFLLEGADAGDEEERRTVGRGYRRRRRAAMAVALEVLFDRRVEA